LTAALRVFLLGLLCTSAAAQSDPRWYLQHDNDVVFFTDRWYTSGLRIARVAFHGEHEVELAVQQDIWTPEAKTFALGRSDRGPDARLYLSVARHDRIPDRHVTWEAGLGVRGPAALGEEVTDAIHRIIAAREVDWSGQPPNKLEAQLTYARSDRLQRVRLHHGVVAGTSLGFAHAGAEWRFGDLQVADLASPVLRFAPTPPWDGGGRRGWSAFAGASYRYVFRNRFVRVPYDPFARDLEYEKGVARFAAGITWMSTWGSLVFAVAQDSHEFQSQRTPQRFGSLTLHLPF
jgi:lipid A 3-O-deacylase